MIEKLKKKLNAPAPEWMQKSLGRVPSSRAMMSTLASMEPTNYSAGIKPLLWRGVSSAVEGAANTPVRMLASYGKAMNNIQDGNALKALGNVGMLGVNMASAYPIGKVAQSAGQFIPKFSQSVNNSLLNRVPGRITTEKIPAHWVNTDAVARFNPLTGKTGTKQSVKRGYGDLMDIGFQNYGKKVQQRLPNQAIERGRLSPSLSEFITSLLNRN